MGLLLKAYCNYNKEMLLELVELFIENHRKMNELASVYSGRFTGDHTTLKFFALKLLFMYEALENSESEIGKKKWTNIKIKDRKGQEITVDYTFKPNTKSVISVAEYHCSPETGKPIGKFSHEFVYMKSFLNTILDRESKDSPYYKAARLLRKYFYFSISEGSFHLYKELAMDDVNGLVKLKGELILHSSHLDYNLSSIALIACNRYTSIEEQEANVLKPELLGDVAMRYAFCRSDSPYTLDSIGMELDPNCPLIRPLDEEVKNFFDYLQFKKEEIMKDWKWFQNELKQCLLMYSNVF